MAKKVISYRDLWRKRFEREEKSYKDILTWDRWEDWDRCMMPDLMAEGNLTMAFAILYSGKGKKYSSAFLQMALEVVQRSADENKFRSKLCKSRYPHNLANATRVREYALAIQSGEFSKQALLESTTNQEKYCKKHNWNNISRSAMLGAARVALIAGSRDHAAQLLRNLKPLRDHEAERKLWKKIAATRSDLPLKDRELRDEFDAIFDPIRSPNFWPKAYMDLLMTRFEMAVLRYKYFCAKDGVIDWKKAIKQVTR